MEICHLQNNVLICKLIREPCHVHWFTMSFQNVTSLQSVPLSWNNKAKVSKDLKSGSSHHYMQRRVQSDLFQWWQEIGRPDVLAFCFSTRSWAGGHRSEWARDSQRPSGRSPVGTARCTWGRFSSGSPHAPQTCSGHSWAGRWPRTADIASCPCCIHGKRAEEEERQGDKAPAISSEVMMWASNECRLIKSICLMRRGWPAPWLIQTEASCAAEQTLNTCYNAQVLEKCRVQQTWMAFMRVWACGLCFTWDQSRRQFVHHSQMDYEFQLLRALRWYYPENKALKKTRKRSQSSNSLHSAHGREHTKLRRSAYIVVVLLLLWLLVAFWPAVVAGGLDTHHITVPGGRAHRGQPKQLVIWELLISLICRERIQRQNNCR